jgi:nucleoid-associated protein YgaU
MNTKVKVGIASAIVAALVALIVLDQKTTPKDDTASKPASGGENVIQVVGPGAEGPSIRIKEEDALYDRARQQFGEKPPKASTGNSLKGAEDPNRKDIKPATSEDYVIKEGDTFETIAQAKYGSKSFSSMIAEANPGLKPTTLRVGKHIVVPAKPVEKKEEAAVVKDAAPPPATEVRPLPAKQPDAIQIRDGQKIYTVQQGDTLSDISVKVYNTSRHYKKIYEANKDSIDDPNTLQVGVKLVMPDLPARAAVANSGAAPSAVVATTNPAPAPAGSKTVQISEGASLWKIAEKFAAEKKIGIHDMIKLIVAANPDKLKDESSLLRLGWQLIIPE